jgi:hypothetical protein
LETIQAAAGERRHGFAICPAVSVDDTTLKDDIAQLFAKYHYRMLPAVDASRDEA